MLRKSVYPLIEDLLLRAGSLLHAKGITPNQLTLAGFLLNLMTGWLYASGHLLGGTAVLVIAGLADMLDGALARASGQATKFGAFLDSTLDRYSDFFLFGGLALYFVRQGQYDLFLVTLGAMAGAFVTSYAKARAENLIEKCNAGFFERAERVILLGIGTLITPALPWVLWILLIGTNATAVQRILYTRKALLGKKP